MSRGGRNARHGDDANARPPGNPHGRRAAPVRGRSAGRARDRPHVHRIHGPLCNRPDSPRSPESRVHRSGHYDDGAGARRVNNRRDLRVVPQCARIPVRGRECGRYRCAFGET